MIAVKKPLNSSEISQGAPILFVEGNNPDSFDRKTLEALFEGKIRVESLGPSSNIKSVAEAFYKYHPKYYFLIDRDHYDDKYVEKCWNNFPDPDEKYNVPQKLDRKIRCKIS